MGNQIERKRGLMCCQTVSVTQAPRALVQVAAQLPTLLVAALALREIMKDVRTSTSIKLQNCHDIKQA